jgi:hypothetical protein
MIAPDARVLVCVVNHLRDLEIARWDHWYRIPLRFAPADYMADHLAFYLTSAFGDEKWAIREYADVRGHELARRIDLLPDQPGHSRAGYLYYKMQIGPLQRLSRPIPSRAWRRITFIETTGDRFMSALDISELVETPAIGRRYVTLMDGLDVEDD